MAIETVKIPLDDTWRLVSNTATGAFDAKYDGGLAHIFQSNSPPDEKSLGEFLSAFSTPALTKKVWARCSPYGAGILTVTRTVDALNPAPLVLNALVLSTLTVSVDSVAGTVVATISGKTDGSKVEIQQADGRFIVSEDGTKLIRRGRRLSVGDLAIGLVETFRKASISPRVTPFTLAIAAPAALAISGTPDAGKAGDDYAFLPTITGGSPPYRVTCEGLGRSGLSVNRRTGATLGILRNGGSYSPSWMVVDSRGAVARLTGKSIVITDPTATLGGGGGGGSPGAGITEFLNDAGQSNAVAADANLFQAADAINDPRVVMWSETGGFAGDPAKAQKVLPYSTPVPFESTNAPGVGPYVTYIQDWLAAAGPNDRLVLVCSARGGTAVHGGRWRYPDGDLSQRMINGTKNAIAAMKALYPANTIRVTTIWQQGESDIGANTPTTPAEYKADAAALMVGFRVALASVGVTDDIWLAGGMTGLYLAGYQTGNVGYNFEQAQVELFTEQPRAMFIGGVGPTSGTAGDTIHYSRAEQLINGHNYFAKRPRAAFLAANVPPAPGPLAINARTLSFKASNCALYAVEVRSPPSTGSWVRTKIHAAYPNEVGDTLTYTVPGSGDFDARMVAISNAGDSAFTNTVTYVTPSETLPAWTTDLDIETASVDGSGNVLSIANIGSYGGSLVPESSAGTAALATVTRSNYGTNNKKTLDLLPAQSLRGVGNPMPTGSASIVMAFFSTSPITSNSWVRTQNDNAGSDLTVGDIFVGFASSGATLKAGVNSTTQQLLTSSALSSGKNFYLAWVYDETSATWTIYVNGVQAGTVGSVPARAQRTATQNYGYKLFGFGRALNTAGIRGRVMAYREANVALTAAQIQTDMAAVAAKFGGISWG